MIFPKRGKAIHYTVNGASRIARGEVGEPAVITMNGKPANINTPLEPNSEVIIDPSVAGADAVYTVSQLEEYTSATIGFIVNGKMVTCPKFVQVNGRLEPGSYQIKDGDLIETRNYYSVAQVAEFMDVELDTDKEIMVNNREADFDTLVYENFTIEWSVLSFGVADEPEKQSYKPVPEEIASGNTYTVNGTEAELKTEFAGMEMVSNKDITSQIEESGVGNVSNMENISDSYGISEQKTTEASQNMSESNGNTPTGSQVIATSTYSALEKQPAGKEIVVFVNGEAVPMSGKEEYIFVDIFDRITFDLNAGKGRAIATILNGRDALFTEQLQHGDKVELYWKEK